jgi:polysaccharide deacetylase family protein (PEP-CTERM system associated)
MPQTLAFGPPVISVDIEDWPQSSWDRELPISERAAVNARRVLDLLREAGVRATMFVLGKFAEKFPRVVRDIHREGHEIACHGYGHIEVFKQSRQTFAEDVRRSKDLLEQIIGERVTGYRAPDFSIVLSTLWALETLADSGFEYDSSVFPIRRKRYGIPDWPVSPVQVYFSEKKSIIEVPIATFRCLNRNWPVGGGGYHRLLPGFVSRRFAKSVMATGPFIFYCHPYEFDVRELKEIPIKIPFHIRLHQGLGRRFFGSRFKAFLRLFGGRPMGDLLYTTAWPKFSPEYLPKYKT